MLQFMVSQRVEHSLATEQQQHKLIVDCLGPVARQQGALSGRRAAPGPGPRSLRKARGQPFSALEVTRRSRRRGQPDASSVSSLSRRAPSRPRPPKQRE